MHISFKYFYNEELVRSGRAWCSIWCYSAPILIHIHKQNSAEVIQYKLRSAISVGCSVESHVCSGAY